MDVALAAGVVEFGDNASSPLNLYMLSYSIPAQSSKSPSGNEQLAAMQACILSRALVSGQL